MERPFGQNSASFLREAGRGAGIVGGWSGLAAPVLAHTIETAADVAATLHVEPNHNPRAGQPARTWFALTRKGGAIIPLEECDCQLLVTARNGQPFSPPLKAIQAEQYEAIPGADIVFPNPGLYQLTLKGRSKDGSFQPFELNYDVTVAAGTTASAPPTSPSPVTTAPTESGPSALGVGGWVLAIALGSGIVWFLRRQRRA